MVLIDLKRPHAVPVFDPIRISSIRPPSPMFDTSFVGGEQVVHDGELTRHDIDETIAAVERLAPKIAASIV